MKIYKSILVLFFIFTIIPIGIAQASDISDARWHGTIRVANNGTTATDLAVNMSLNSAYFISNGYSNSELNDLAIQINGTDTAFGPSVNESYQWWLHVPSIEAYTSADYDIYSGNVTDGKLAFFPDDSGMTVADDASLEPGDNATIRVLGFADTDNGSNKDIFRKDGAARAYWSNDEEISFRDYTTPTGYNDPGTGWTNDFKVVDDSEATYADTSPNIPATSWSDPLEFTYATGINITGMQYLCGGETADIDQINLDVYYSGGWHDVYEGAFTQDVWEEKTGSYTNVTNARIYLYNSGGGAVDGYIYEFDFLEAPLATVTGVEKDDHDIEVAFAPLLFKEGNTIHFDGTTNSHVDLGNIYSSDNTVWVSFWFRLDNSGQDTKYLWAKWKDSNNRIYMYVYSSDDKIRFYNKGAVSFNLEADFPQDTNWHHVIASISATDGGRLRLDHGPASVTANSGVTPSSGNWLLGDKYAAGGGGFTGTLANFIIGTDNLTRTEEKQLFDNTFPGDQTELYYIDEGTGTNVISYGTSSNNGTVAANATWVETVRPVKFALSIDDTVEYSSAREEISIPDTDSDWYFAQNGSMLYLENAEIDSSLVAWTRDSGNPIKNGVSASGPADIVLSGSTYHLFYHYYSTPWRPGHATLANLEAAMSEDGDNPIVDIGAAGEWDEWTCQGIAVLKDIETGEALTYSEADLGISADETDYYWMFYCGSEPSSVNAQIGIARNTSLSGDWTKYTAYSPCLSYGSSGWDSTGVGGFGLQVFLDNGTFKMLYTGTQGTYESGIGLATSSDLVNWTKYDSNPLLWSSDINWFTGWLEGNPGIWKQGGIYTLLYTGSNQGGFAGSIGRQTGFSLTELVDDENNPIAWSDGDEAWEEKEISDVTLFHTDNRSYIFYEGEDGIENTGRMWCDDIFRVKGYWQWEYNTTFSDVSGHGNTATPSFRTVASDSDVSAELISFSPVSEAKISTFTLSSINEILTGNATMPGGMYTELEFTYIPGSDIPNEILDESDTPQALWWFPFIFITIGILGLLSYQATTLRARQGTISLESQQMGSMIVMCAVMEIFLGLLGTLNPIPFWPAILFLIPAMAIIISQKHYSWG